MHFILSDEDVVIDVAKIFTTQLITFDFESIVLFTTCFNFKQGPFQVIFPF